MITFEDIALNAVNKLFMGIRENPYNQELRSLNKEKISKITRRWGTIVYLTNRYVYGLEEESIYINGSHFHPDDVSSCDHCEEYTVDTNSVYSRNRNGRLIQQIWCESCVDNDSFYCHGCDERFNEDEAREYNDSSYCNECFNNLDRDEIPSYHSAKRWIAPDYDSPLYSMELELEADDRESLVQHLNCLAYPKISWEMDGSLDRSKGLEILIQLRESTDQLSNDTCNLLSNIKKRGFSLSSWNNKKCGIHINANKGSVWTLNKVMRLLYCVRSAKKHLIRISGRESDQWASWDSRGMKLRQQANGGLGKYTMIRVGSDRFEWRMFRGTLNEKRVSLYCETVKQFEALALSNISSNKLKQAAIELGNKLANTL
jgi:hypothetical protein